MTKCPSIKVSHGLLIRLLILPVVELKSDSLGHCPLAVDGEKLAT